jgi:hypothetical protein
VVTLTGPGGVGKTRPALAAGPQLRSLCPDGVWFVELASLGEETLVAQTVASALGLPEEAPRSPLEILIGALGGRQAFLAPRPPLERAHHDRLMASLRDHLGERGGELASMATVPEPVVAEELAAAGHTSPIPRPTTGNPKTGAPPMSPP